MSELSVAMAKLSGIRKAVVALMSENVSDRRSAGVVRTRSNFRPAQIEHYFSQAPALVETLRKLLPEYFEDFQQIETLPTMRSSNPHGPFGASGF